MSNYFSFLGTKRKYSSFWTELGKFGHSSASLVRKDRDVRNRWTNEILTQVYSATWLVSSEIVPTLTIKDTSTLDTQPNRTETQQFHQKN